MERLDTPRPLLLQDVAITFTLSESAGHLWGVGEQEITQGIVPPLTLPVYFP